MDPFEEILRSKFGGGGHGISLSLTSFKVEMIKKMTCPIFSTFLAGTEADDLQNPSAAK
jgi:hypothetical protein